jgi:hypothetical protein
MDDSVNIGNARELTVLEIAKLVLDSYAQRAKSLIMHCRPMIPKSEDQILVARAPEMGAAGVA